MRPLLAAKHQLNGTPLWVFYFQFVDITLERNTDQKFLNSRNSQKNIP